MRARFHSFAAAGLLALAPALAGAETVEGQLDAMNRRMETLQSELEAAQEALADTQSELETQEKIIEEADVLEQDGRSGLSAFLSETEFSGHISTSYSYNFNFPEASAMVNGGGRNSSGNLGLTAPFHGQSNNFQLDQFLLAMKKEATPESRAGWGFTLAWGEAADVMNGKDAFEDDFYPTGDTLISPYVHRAYVEYLVNVGSGLNVRLGRFGTPVGAESFSDAENLNITRGLLWTLQPVDHTGLEISGDCLNGIDWSLAVTNDYNNANIDSDRSKTFVGHVGYARDTWSVGINGVWGGNIDNTFYGYAAEQGPGTDEDAVGLLDVVVRYDPTDRLSLWFNGDYFWSQDSEGQGSSSLNIAALGIAGRYAITEKTGFALRAEYVAFSDGWIETNPDDFDDDGGAGADSSLWSITGTLDHALTENLSVRGEVRYDHGKAAGSNDHFFPDETNTYAGDDDVFYSENQVLGLIQLLYRF